MKELTKIELEARVRQFKEDPVRLQILKSIENVLLESPYQLPSDSSKKVINFLKISLKQYDQANYSDIINPDHELTN